MTKYSHVLGIVPAHAAPAQCLNRTDGLLSAGFDPRSQTARTGLSVSLFVTKSFATLHAKSPRIKQRDHL